MKTKVRLLTMAVYLSISVMVAFTFLSGNVSAGMIEDVPDALAGALGISVDAAEAILSGFVLVSISIALSIGKIKMIPMAMIMIIILAILVMIQWLDTWLLILVALIAGLMFAKMMRDVIT